MLCCPIVILSNNCIYGWIAPNLYRCPFRNAILKNAFFTKFPPYTFRQTYLLLKLMSRSQEICPILIGKIKIGGSCKIGYLTGNTKHTIIWSYKCFCFKIYIIGIFYNISIVYMPSVGSLNTFFNAGECAVAEGTKIN